MSKISFTLDEAAKITQIEGRSADGGVNLSADLARKMARCVRLALAEGVAGVDFTMPQSGTEQALSS